MRNENSIKPKIALLSEELIQRVLDEAFLLMSVHGIKVQAAEALQLLGEAGAKIDKSAEVAFIPEELARRCLESAPQGFTLYNRDGKPTVRYAGDAVQFDPGSSGVHVLDPETLEHRPSRTLDLVKIIQVTEMLPEFAAQSTAVVCNEVAKEIGDLYRLYLVLRFSNKPVVTGAFSIPTLQTMFDMLTIFAGSREALRQKPQAVFDVCPSPPLVWSAFGAQNLIELARAGVPAQMVPMPLAGAASPVTLLGSVVQHAAESISGIVIHQLANPGSPIVWGGAPAIFDMRRGTTPMGAIETAMINVSYSQVGKFLGLPTHTYLGASDAKVVDAQAGLESGVGVLVGALAGINMISGAGMLDYLACFSPEKLVIDAEAIATAQRMLKGVQVQTETLATEFFAGIEFKGEFLKQKATRQLFPIEQHLPSSVIDRDTLRGWSEAGKVDTFGRARLRLRELLEEYQPPSAREDQMRALVELVSDHARAAGMERLPATS